MCVVSILFLLLKQVSEVKYQKKGLISHILKSDTKNTEYQLKDKNLAIRVPAKDA